MSGPSHRDASRARPSDVSRADDAPRAWQGTASEVRERRAGQSRGQGLGLVAQGQAPRCGLMETAGVEPAPPECKSGALPLELHPRACGRMESNHHSAWHRGYSAESSPSAQRPQRGWPTGFEPVLRGSQPRVLPVTPRPP